MRSVTVQHGEGAWPTLSTHHNPDDDPEPEDFETREGNSRVDHTSSFSFNKHSVPTTFQVQSQAWGHTNDWAERVPVLMEFTIEGGNQK